MCGVLQGSIWGPIFISDWTRQCGALIMFAGDTTLGGDDQVIHLGEGLVVRDS